MKNLELNKVYECSNGENVWISHFTTTDEFRTIFYGCRVIDAGNNEASIEEYTEDGTHFWDCDLDIISEIKKVYFADHNKEEKPWHTP